MPNNRCCIHQGKDCTTKGKRDNNTTNVISNSGNMIRNRQDDPRVTLKGFEQYQNDKVLEVEQ